MRTFALVALLAATVYADGHLPTNSTMVEEHHDEHHDEHYEGDEMNTAEQLVKAIDDITELFMEEADLIHEGKINPKALEGAADFKSLLEMVCEVSHDDHMDGEHHEDAEHNRMLDGHDSNSICDIFPDADGCNDHKDDHEGDHEGDHDASHEGDHHEAEHHEGEHHEDMDMDMMDEA